MRLARDRTRQRRGWRGMAAVAVAACCAMPASGCGLFGAGAEVATPSVMTVTSGELAAHPADFTCAAHHAVSPPLGWAGWPQGTKSIAVVADDSNAPITPYVYWVVFNISPATSDILKGQLPQGALQARNSGGTTGYEPPCPGPGGHTYRFTVYALDRVLDLPAGTSLESAWRAIAASAIGRGRLTVSVKAPAARP